jgi:hypothetical protein
VNLHLLREVLLAFLRVVQPLQGILPGRFTGSCLADRFRELQTPAAHDSGFREAQTPAMLDESPDRNPEVFYLVATATFIGYALFL